MIFAADCIEITLLLHTSSPDNNDNIREIGLGRNLPGRTDRVTTELR